MTIIRLVNGHDIMVKLSVSETLKLLQKGGDAFVEIPGDETSIHLRPSAVIAVTDDTRKSTTGFRFSSAG